MPAGDEPRFLHRTIGRAAYTIEPALGVTGEQECVTEREQSAMTRRVHEAERARQLRAAAEAQARVTDAVESYLASRPPRQLESSARALQRCAAALVANARRVL